MIESIQIPDIYDALICLDADLPDKEFFFDFKNIPIICADGAGNRIIDKGIIPDFIVGDLDTLDFDSLPNEVKLIERPDQDSNDFEKSLNFAIENEFKTLLILGLHGGVLEHTLNNWSILIKYMKSISLWIYDKGRIGMPTDRSISIDCVQGEIISLIPQPEVTLTTKNLQWELNKETLRLGQREGARNVALSSNVQFILHKGSVLIFKDYIK